MRFLISGADRQTGEDVEMSFKATDEREALNKANARGILVTGCQSASRITAPSALSSNRSPFPFAHEFFDRFVFQAARGSSSVGKMRAGWALALLATVIFALMALVGVLGFFPGVDIAFGMAVIMTLVAIPAFLCSFANACYLMERLKHPGEQTPTQAPPPPRPTLHPLKPVVSTQPISSSPIARPQPIQFRVFSPRMIAAITALISFGVVTGTWSYLDRESKLHPPLPKIRVTGFGASHVNFTDWKIELTHLTGVVQFHGESFVELSYRVTKDGVLQDTGAITPPTGGTSITTQQPMSIDIYLPSRPSNETEVEIIATGG